MGLTNQFDILDDGIYNVVVRLNSDGRKRI